MFFENTVPCSQLHLVGGAMGKRYDDQLRQNLHGIPGSREVDDPCGDRLSFARSGGSDHGKVPVELFGEATPGGGIARFVHQNISSSSRTSAGWVNSQRCSRMSGSIASVASG